MSEAKTRRIVSERSGNECEMCRRSWATNMHHRKNRSQGGEWAPQNILHLCGTGTTGCHGWVTSHPRAAHRIGYVVRSWEDPAEVPVDLRGRMMLPLEDGTWKDVES